MPEIDERIISNDVDKNKAMSTVLKSDCTWIVTLEMMKE